MSDQDELAAPEHGRFEVLKRTARLFRPHGRTLVAASVLLGATTALQLTGPLLIRRAIDVDIAGRSVQGLIATVAAYVGVQILFLLLNYVQKVRLEKMGQEIIFGLRSRLFAHLLRQGLAFFDRNPVGRLISRVQSDTDALRQMFASTVVSLVEALCLFAGMMAVMAAIDVRLTLVVAATVPPMILTAWLLAVGGAKRFRIVRRWNADIAAYVAERIQGIGLLQAFGREAHSTGELRGLNREKLRAMIRAEIFGIGLFHGVFYFEIVGLALVLWFGGQRAIAGTLTLGTLFMFIEYLRRLFEPIARLSEQLDVMQRAYAAAGRVFTILDLPPAVTDPERPERWERFERAIEFRDVGFSYFNNGEWALEDVSFTIPRGQKWAIVGATGGGKSSILSLLLRFYDPQKGKVLVDGIEVRALTQHDLRAKMALVLQDVYLFPGDILSNLAPNGIVETGGDAARYVEAARMAGAGPMLDRMPSGVHTELAERGANLSAGERQILSFARALAADPEILLLDEATASVDPGTEAEIQRALARLLEGRTAIVIAHRLSTVRDCDGILVVQGGRIVERGRHEELLASGGVYADLHALQFALPAVGGGVGARRAEPDDASSATGPATGPGGGR